MTDEMLTPERAAQHAADPDRLLPGEGTASALGTAADARHWMSVYGELLTFKEELLDLSRSRMGAMSEDAQAEARSDQVLMEREAQRFRRRIAVWRGRLEEFRAGGHERPGDPGSDGRGDRMQGR